MIQALPPVQFHHLAVFSFSPIPSENERGRGRPSFDFVLSKCCLESSISAGFQPQRRVRVVEGGGGRWREVMGARSLTS